MYEYVVITVTYRNDLCLTEGMKTLKFNCHITVHTQRSSFILKVMRQINIQLLLIFYCTKMQ